MNDQLGSLRSHRRQGLWRWIVFSVLLASTVLGAHATWFLCDDAYITFRYVANARAGHGLVWNPAPFLPIEGYTSFSWAMLLWVAWSWFGVEPPDAANVMAIGCGAVLFTTVAFAAVQIRHRDGRPGADRVALVVLLLVASNRTFLQWFTSGLETALFNAAFVGWVLWAWRRPASGAGWLLAWSSLATITALTRPDGLLAVGATVAVAVFDCWRRRYSWRAALIGLLPLVAVAMHGLWRRWFYGDWLPNTYHAKVAEPWPEAGLRYFACFVVEHGTWVAVPVAIVWLVRELCRPAAWWRAMADRAAASTAVAVVLIQVGYYAVVVGGDHFEYRVFSHLVPLIALAVAAMATASSVGRGWPLAATLILAVASTAGWWQCVLTRDNPRFAFQAIAPQLPAPLAPLLRWYDRYQAWLTFHLIGLRCHHHGDLLASFRTTFPRRLRIADPGDGFPVFVLHSAGYAGWVLGNTYILDHYGLSDWVTARNQPSHLAARAPTDPVSVREALQVVDRNRDGWFDRGELLAFLPEMHVSIVLTVFGAQRDDALTSVEAEAAGAMLDHPRLMAHDRRPPAGYVEDFEPNLLFAEGEARVRPRAVPLTAERVIELERQWRARTRVARSGG